jgi:Holliday junction resolvase RusA-like endonuclease
MGSQGKRTSTGTLTLVVEGPPLRKNERHEIVVPKQRKPGMPPAWLKNTKAYDAFALRVTNRWRREGSHQIRSGAWHVDCVAYFPRTRKLDVPVAFGDIDATISAALDALQDCGAVDDDVRFITGTLAKHVDKDEPRVELTLRPAGPSIERLTLEKIAKSDARHPAPLRAMAEEALTRAPARQCSDN